MYRFAQGATAPPALKVLVSLWGRSAARGQRVQKMVAPYGAQILKKGGAAGAAGCVEGLCRKVRKMDGPYGPKGS